MIYLWVKHRLIFSVAIIVLYSEIRSFPSFVVVVVVKSFILKMKRKNQDERKNASFILLSLGNCQGCKILSAEWGRGQGHGRGGR